MILRERESLDTLLAEVSSADQEARFIANFVRMEGVVPSITIADGKSKIKLPDDWSDDKFLLWPMANIPPPIRSRNLFQLAEHQFPKRGADKVTRTLLLMTDEDIDPFIVALGVIFNANCIYEFHRAVRIPKMRVRMRGYPLDQELDLSYESFAERGVWRYESALIISRLLENKFHLNLALHAQELARSNPPDIDATIVRLQNQLIRVGLDCHSSRAFREIGLLTSFALATQVLPETAMRQILAGPRPERHPVASAFFLKM